MRRGGTLLVLLGLGIASTCCTWTNDVDPCGAKPSEVRYSATTDQFELVGHPRAATRISDGRILALYERNESSAGVFLVDTSFSGHPDRFGVNVKILEESQIRHGHSERSGLRRSSDGA